jgi:hypothetical protein
MDRGQIDPEQGGCSGGSTLIRRVVAFILLTLRMLYLWLEVLVNSRCDI